jgi:hypothetical protein
MWIDNHTLTCSTLHHPGFLVRHLLLELLLALALLFLQLRSLCCIPRGYFGLEVFARRFLLRSSLGLAVLAPCPVLGMQLGHLRLIGVEKSPERVLIDAQLVWIPSDFGAELRV